MVVADILTVAGALAAELEERPWATLVPHVLPAGEPGFPVYSVGAVYPRTRAGARLWRLSRPLLMRGEEQGRRELNGARARVGLPPLGTRPGRDLTPPGPGGHLPPARVPPAPTGARPEGDRPAALGAALRRDRASAGRRPTRAGGPQHLARPPGPSAAGRARGAGRRAGAGAGQQQPARPRRSGRRPAEREARRLGLIRARDAPLRGGGLPRGPRNPRPGPRLRRSGRGLPARRATWPRTPRACAGPAWACRFRAASTRPGACGWRFGGCSRSRPTPAARASCGHGTCDTTGPPARPRRSRAFAVGDPYPHGVH